MTSKMSMKPGKKEGRPRSSDKLRRVGKGSGTPEKPTTPSASLDGLQEDGATGTDRKNVIIDEQIRSFEIKPEALEKLRQPQPPEQKKRTPVTSSVLVRKLKPATELNRPPPKLVTIARPAPPDAPVPSPDLQGAAGPRFDHAGRIIPCSILGSVDDYLAVAQANGDLPQDFRQTEDCQQGALTVKYEKKTRCQMPRFESQDESNALKNWQKRMLERRKQQDYLAALLDKAPEQLVMNQADSYRQTQELRYIIDRTIPTVDYGKGYRIGSEFWQQQEQIGDELTGMHVTLTQTGKGYPAPLEHVGVPQAARREKGTLWERPRSAFHKPWHRTPYLRERKAQLQGAIDELDPHRPEMLELEVVGRHERQTPASREAGEEGEEGQDSDPRASPGSSEYTFTRHMTQPESDQQAFDPLGDLPDVHPEPVFGPSLRFAGQAARWTGDSATFRGQRGLEARVALETVAGQRTTACLEVVNDGTTCVYYDWKKIPKTNPFDIMTAKVQRFYFNTSSGVILPGDTVRFPFVFKSQNAGVFAEQWQLETRPVLCGGAALVVTLRGVAIAQDKFKKEISELEAELSHKQAEQIVTGILRDLLESIRTPERPRSPVDAYIMESEMFERRNTGLYYDCETIQKLKSVYRELFPIPEPEEPGDPAPTTPAPATTPAATPAPAATPHPATPADRTDPEAGPEVGTGLGSARGSEAGPVEGEGTQEADDPGTAVLDPPEWDLSVQSLKECLLEPCVVEVTEDVGGEVEREARRQEMLHEVNLAVVSLSFPPFTPSQREMYCVGYRLLSEAIDDMSTEAAFLRQTLGLPELDLNTQDDQGSIPPSGKASRASGRRSSRPTSGPNSDAGLSSAKSERGDQKKPSATGKASKTDSKEKKAGKEPKKEAPKASAKGHPSPATPAKAEPPKGGKITPGAKRSAAKDLARAPSAESDRQTPALSATNALQEAKFKEKLHAQTYLLLSDTMDKMAASFEAINEAASGNKQLTLM